MAREGGERNLTADGQRIEKTDRRTRIFNQRRHSMRNEISMTRRTVMAGLIGLAGSMVLTPLVPAVSHAGHESQLREMVGKGDHAGLAEFYKKQAEEARHNAAGMKAMASEYLKKYPKGAYSKHCEKMGDKYLEEAKENDALAEMHSKAAKGGK
jgi:hypothetical protein